MTNSLVPVQAFREGFGLADLVLAKLIEQSLYAFGVSWFACASLGAPA